jgi:hypothetical protein
MPIGPGVGVVTSSAEMQAELLAAVGSAPAPFRLDPVAWSGSVENECWGESDWVIAIDGETASFDSEEWLGELGRVPVGELQTLLEVDGGGSSMTTGPIGTTIYVDAFGDAWISRWGFDRTYLGPATSGTPIDPVAEMVYSCFGDGAMGICLVTSDTLTADRLVPLLEAADRSGVCDLDELEVECVDFSGTATELLGQRPGHAAQ